MDDKSTRDSPPPAGSPPEGEPGGDTAGDPAHGDPPSPPPDGDRAAHPPPEAPASRVEPPGSGWWQRARQRAGWPGRRSGWRPGRRWIAAGVVIGAAALAGFAVWFAAAPPPPAPAAVTARPGGGAALRAPEGPALAAAPVGARLTGFVVDGAGAPVAGAEVSAEPERGAPDREPAAPRDRVPAGSGAGSNSAAQAGSSAGSVAGPGAGAGRAAAGSGTRAPPVVVTGSTGGDGRFALAGLAAGRARLHVTGAGLVPAELRYVPVPSDDARIVVARQVAIEGSVSDGGAPVAHAMVALRGDAIGGTIETRSDPAGRFRFGDLPEGRYQVFAWQAALAARTIRVARLGAGPFGPVELRLEAAAIVVGRVIDRDEGTGLAAAIELRASGDDQAPRYARSGEDGVFRIEGVPSGRWIADAFVPGYVSPGGIELDAGRGVSELGLTRGGAIEGRVLDGDGHPIAGAAVRAVAAGQAAEISAEVDRDKLRRFSGRSAAPAPVAGAPGSDPELVVRGELGVLVGPIPPIPPPGAQVAHSAIAVDPSLAGEPSALPVDPAKSSIWITGADGAYRIRGFGRARVTVLASAAGFAEARSQRVAIDAGQLISRIDLILSPGTLVVGKVTDQHGAPVIGAQVAATPVSAGSRGALAGARDPVGTAITAFSDEAGEYKLGPVSGAIELHASAYGHGEARRTIELATARGAVPAERREDLVLAVADAMIDGILEDATGAPVAAAEIEVVGGVSDGRRASSARDGAFSIDRLPQGPLRLRVAHPSYPPDEFDAVAAGGHPARLRLRLALGGAVEGAVLDAASGAAISSAALVASGPGSALAEASSDKSGRWALGPLRPGRWRIAIKLPGYLAISRELDVPVAHSPGAISLRDIRIELARGALLGGTVRDARGQRVVAAHIVAGSAGGGGPTCEADSDGQGEFRIHDCPTGELAVAAIKAGARGQTRTTVRPGDEILSLALELR